jgi:hypothetical protein
LGCRNDYNVAISPEPRIPSKNRWWLVAIVQGGFSYNSELPGGRAPFWIRDDALVKLGLGPGDAVAVDGAREPQNGDLVLVEVVVDEDQSGRIVRRYFEDRGDVTLRAENDDVPDLVISADQLFVVGVVTSKVRYERLDDERTRIIEEPLPQSEPRA